MAVPYYGLLSLHDESDSDGAEDWFLEPGVASVMPGDVTLRRSGGIRGHHGGMRRCSDGYLDCPDTQQSFVVPRRRPDGRSSDTSSNHHHTLQRLMPVQALTVPPRNPARLSIASSHQAPPSSLTPEPRLHRWRRSSNVDGATVSLLAANVISTTNNIFSAMIQHADSNNNSDVDDIHVQNDHDDTMNGDADTTLLHPSYHRHGGHHSSYSYSSNSNSLPTTGLSHRR